jgi:Enterochelin esterase and related enzymes
MCSDLKALMKSEPRIWLTSDHVGSDLWWQCLLRLGGPFESDDCSSKRVKGTKRVDFFWRDPEGEKLSNTAQVLLDINSVTNHKSWDPVSLNRVKNTDVWHQAIEVDALWRGSYGFIPLSKEQTSQVAYASSDGSSEAQREWYISIMDQAISDPLNPRPDIVSGRGCLASPLIMKSADTEIGWTQWDKGELPEFKRDEISTIRWNSRLLNNARRVWHFETGLDNDHSLSDIQQKPIVILLDGQRWSMPSGAPSVLAYLTRIGMLAPAHYLLIDSIDGKTRWGELSCNAQFWDAVFSELKTKCLMATGCLPSNRMCLSQGRVLVVFLLYMQAYIIRRM